MKNFKKILALVVVLSLICVTPAEAGVNRDMAYKYMYKMATVKWKSGKKHTTLMCKVSKNKRYYVHWYKRVSYKGIPYSQKENGAEVNLQYFNQLNKKKIKKDYGRNDCSSSIMYSWREIGYNPDLNIATCVMFPESAEMKKVGTYKYKSGQSHSKTCKKNGLSKMAKSYAKLKKADAIVNDGHTRMVKSVVVKKKKNGKINYDKSYVKVIEQTGTLSWYKRSTWLINKKYSFRNLYSYGYIPVTIPQLDGPAAYKIQSADASYINNNNVVFNASLYGARPVSKWGIYFGKNYNDIKSISSKTEHISKKSYKYYSLLKRSKALYEKNLVFDTSTMFTTTGKKLSFDENETYYYRIVCKADKKWRVSKVYSFTTTPVSEMPEETTTVETTTVNESDSEQ